MKTGCYLIVTDKGGVRLTKNLGRVGEDEVALRVRLEVPDSLFRRPVPVVNVTIEEPAADPIHVEVGVSEVIVAVDPPPVEEGVEG